MNAKACTVVELYGTLDPVTRDWTDGLLSCIFREINKPTDKNERKYIVFDSDVDALWVENMNSVMDDNRLLTLANGERIRLQKHCALLFEVGHDADFVDTLILLKAVCISNRAGPNKITVFKVLLKLPESCELAIRTLETHCLG